jgi:hypothetical protein
MSLAVASSVFGDNCAAMAAFTFLAGSIMWRRSWMYGLFIDWFPPRFFDGSVKSLSPRR